MSKIKYYSIKNMLKTEAQYMMLLGQRSNGKSYQAKKTVIESALAGKKFVYLRRWKEDIKTKSVENYFKDMDFPALTNGEYVGISAYANILYFDKIDEKGNRVKAKEIGFYCALNEYERYKSWVFDSVEWILYEEFITDSVYLNDEPRLLQQFVSTVARLRAVHVLLIGNTLSRVCPYFSEWCLDGVLRQKQGTIEIYHYHVQDSIINIAVEYCTNINAENKMFFGQTAKQIISGEWDTKDVAKLPRPKNEYEKVYEVLLEFQKFAFVIELLIEPQEGGAMCYVYPYTSNRKIYRKITEVFSDNPFISSKLDITKKPEAIMSKCIALGKVCFSDNLTGSDFNNVLSRFKI